MKANSVQRNGLYTKYIKNNFFRIEVSICTGRLQEEFYQKLAVRYDQLNDIMHVEAIKVDILHDEQSEDDKCILYAHPTLYIYIFIN